MILEVVKSDHQVLRKKARQVKKIDKKIIKLVQDMKQTLLAHKDPEGVGLAAPQVGISYCIFIMQYKDGLLEVINPKVLKRSKAKTDAKKTKILEGCLSMPKYYGPVSRAKSITIKYLDIEGKSHIQTFKGFPAQIVQHETDHLKGTLFVDKLLEQKSPLYEYKNQQWEQVDLIP